MHDEGQHIGLEIKDREEIKEELKDGYDGSFIVCCIDESEHINIFS